jgi:putative hydrolase of the HAD superfamily
LNRSTVRAVFFDLYNTLVRFDPPRERQQMEACRAFGLEVDLRGINKGYEVADQYWTEENARFPFTQRDEAGRSQFYAAYQSLILKGAGVEAPPDLCLKIISHILRQERRFALFDDVVPVLTALKDKGVALGLISNISSNIDQIYHGLGLSTYLGFVVTPDEVGATKPDPRIFLAALERAAVTAEEAIHVGDQYQSDVVGARGVGIKPLLLDRDGVWSEVDDCPRIAGLDEVLHHLDADV